MARRNRNTERSASATKNVKPRIRIKELRTVRVGDLVPNPENWRTHPDEQRRAFNAAVERVGIADAPKVWESPDGLMILDGHLRAEELDDDAEIPVQVLDVDEDEARFLLATYDPMAMLAQADKEATAALLEQLDASSDLEALVAEMEKAALLFEPVDYEAEWAGMPEFAQEDQSAWKRVIVNFTSAENLQAFAELVGQPMTGSTRSIWYPQAERATTIDKRYVDKGDGDATS